MILQCSHGPCDTPKRLWQSVTWVLKWVSFYLIIAFSETLHQHICNRQVRKKTQEAYCILGSSVEAHASQRMLKAQSCWSFCPSVSITIEFWLTLALWPKRGILFGCSKRRNAGIDCNYWWSANTLLLVYY